MRALCCLAFIAPIFVTAASPAEAPSRDAARSCPDGNQTSVYTQTGIASWYTPQALGRRTASGERSTPNRMTAAHRTLPMGSVVHVLNLENCRAVTVTINDRGPFGRWRPARILDLSKRAALALGIEHAGIAPVRLEKYASDQR